MALSQRVGRHLRGNLVAYVALFVALSGTAIALPGKNKVKSNDLARGAVEGRALAADAVGAAKVRPGAITSGAINDRSVVNVDLGDAAVTTSKLVDAAVTRSKIVAGAINGGKLANGSVNSTKVNDGSLVAADFAAGELSAGVVRNGDGTINLSRAGRLFVVATFFSACGAGPCNDTYEVTVDGAPVTNADAVRLGSDDMHLTLIGVTPSLTAGNHAIALTQTDGGATETQVVLGGVLLQ